MTPPISKDDEYQCRVGAGNVKRLPDVGTLFDVLPVPGGSAPLALAIAMPNQTLTRRPGFPAAALPQSGRIASGRGLDAETCRASVLGEAAELVSCCAWGNEKLVTAKDAELGVDAIGPDAVNGFSPEQIDDRAAWNARYGDFDWRPKRFDPNRPIDWLRVAAADGGPSALIPADFAFIGRKERGDETTVSIGDSNGCACGADAEAAKSAALLELIERDATARWWYGRRQRPLLDLAVAGEGGGLVAWLRARRRRSVLFDITSDIGVPVAAAISAEDDGRDVAMGFAAAATMATAAFSALTEMVQMEFSLAAARQIGDAAGQWPEWRRRVTLATPPLAPQAKGQASPTVSSTLADLLAACGRAGIGVWFADMTRPEIGVPAFRALAPALCHTKPRFGRARLLAHDRRDLGPVTPDPQNQVPLLV